MRFCVLDMIRYDIFVKLQLGCHPVAVIQYSTHLHITVHRTTQNSTQNDTKILEECEPCPIFARFTLAFALQLRKNHGKPSVRVAEECQLAR